MKCIYTSIIVFPTLDVYIVTNFTTRSSLFFKVAKRQRNPAEDVQCGISTKTHMQCKKDTKRDLYNPIGQQSQVGDLTFLCSTDKSPTDSKALI